MSRFSALVVVVLALAACDSATPTSESGPTTTSASTLSTTTTIINDNCELVATDTVAFLDSLIRVLDDTRLEEFKDRAAWPEDLSDLERASRDLDIRAGFLACDPALIQQRALDEANLDPRGPLSEGLIDELLTPPTTSTTTTTKAADTTQIVDTTEAGDTTTSTP